jgi:hypothetical protein
VLRRARLIQAGYAGQGYVSLPAALIMTSFQEQTMKELRRLCAIISVGFYVRHVWREKILTAAQSNFLAHQMQYLFATSRRRLRELSSSARFIAIASCYNPG